MLKSLVSKLPRVRALAARIAAADEQVQSLTTANAQLADALRLANLPPIPPRHLQERVVGGYFPDFVGSGVQSVTEFAAMLARVGKAPGDFERVLDFGVGCGRIIRSFHAMYSTPHLTGADIDPEAIAWLQENYVQIGDFQVAPHLPPTGFEDAAFDLVYANSVFTHLDEAMQFAWLDELRRITRPGGLLLLTVHRGQNLVIPAEAQHEVDAKGFYFYEAGPPTDGLPAFYRTTIHSRAYVEREWSRFFTLLHYEELGCMGHQDLILWERR